jgi:hypothetical protein
MKVRYKENGIGRINGNCTNLSFFSLLGVAFFFSLCCQCSRTQTEVVSLGSKARGETFFNQKEQVEKQNTFTTAQRRGGLGSERKENDVDMH